jgi:hypothetical protein
VSVKEWVSVTYDGETERLFLHLANEKASRASRVRAELSQSAFEQKDYLRKVERARVMRDKEERRKAREAKGPVASGGDDNKGGQEQRPKAKERTFKQREAIVKDVREQRDKKRTNEDASSVPPSKKFKSSGGSEQALALQGALSKIF